MPERRLRPLAHRPSAAGKSTIAGLVADELEARGVLVDRLDGDVVRDAPDQGARLLEGGPRHEHRAHRLGRLAARPRRGAVVVVSAISPYEEARQKARALTEEHATFVEVYVATSLEECERRDPKGLYAMAHAGEIREFTGVADPYEEPVEPRAPRSSTEGRTPDESAGRRDRQARRARPRSSRSVAA